MRHRSRTEPACRNSCGEKEKNTYLDDIKCLIIQQLLLPELRCTMRVFVLGDALKVVLDKNLEDDGPQCEPRLASEGVDHGGSLSSLAEDRPFAKREGWVVSDGRGARS